MMSRVARRRRRSLPNDDVVFVKVIKEDEEAHRDSLLLSLCIILRVVANSSDMRAEKRIMQSAHDAHL